MSDRTEFENRFPVPEGVFWDLEFARYSCDDGEFGPDADEYHQMWQVWQAARSQSGQGAEPVALLQREIGESTWFDHVPVKPNTQEAEGLKASPILDYCEVYTHPQPARQGSVPSRDDLIQCLLATRGQSEGVAADAILWLFSAATPQPAQQGSVPEGWKLVPVEPTKEMRYAYHEAYQRYLEGSIPSPDGQWWAMLDAAPQPEGDGWVPKGWKLVPIEPTPDMRRAFHEAHELFEYGEEVDGSPDDEWRAMLDAAPQPPKEGE